MEEKDFFVCFQCFRMYYAAGHGDAAVGVEIPTTKRIVFDYAAAQFGETVFLFILFPDIE